MITGGKSPIMQDSLRAAIALHQAGQLGQAAQVYQQVLAQDPSNADALHLLGVLHHQQGNNPRAVELIGRAVALRPNVGGVSRQSGRALSGTGAV